MIYTIENYSDFLDTLFDKLSGLQVGVSAMELDHLAYRTKTSEEFWLKRKAFQQIGVIVAENVIRNRPIPVFELYKPFAYKGREINCLELMAPAEGDRYESGLQHAEFVVREDLYSFMKRYPQLTFIDKIKEKRNNPEVVLPLGEGLAVKFHPLALLKVVMIEKETGVL